MNINVYIVKELGVFLFCMHLISDCILKLISIYCRYAVITGLLLQSEMPCSKSNYHRARLHSSHCIGNRTMILVYCQLHTLLY
jgi:hypothetical protein